MPAQGSADPLPSFGPLRVSISEFGGYPGNIPGVLDGGGNPIPHDNQPAIQAAHDYLRDQIAASVPGQSGVTIPATIFFPSQGDFYYCGPEPVYLDHGSITIEGEGPGSLLRKNVFTSTPFFVTNILRKSTHNFGSGNVTVKADSNYRPDVFGKLDTSMATGTGQRWGFRCYGPYHGATLYEYGGAFSAGPIVAGVPNNWRNVQTFTIDFAIEAFSGGVTAALPGNRKGLLGIGDSIGDNNVIYPVGFATYNSSGDLQIFINGTATPGGAPVGPPFVVFPPNITGTGVHKCTLQVHMGGAVNFYVDGTQTFHSTNLGTGWSSALYTVENPGLPFWVADDTTGYGMSANASHTEDLAFYGICASTTLRYADNGVSSAQVRADAGTINDAYRYLGTGDSGTFAHYEFTENPATLTRNIKGSGSGGGVTYSTTSLLVHNIDAGLLYQGNTTFNRLHMIGAGPFGFLVGIHNLNRFRVERCTFEGGYAGVGSLSSSATYFVSIEKCSFDCNDAQLNLTACLGYAKSIDIPHNGRDAFRFFGCELDISDVFVASTTAASQTFLAAYRYDYGSDYFLKNITIDTESGGFLRAGLYIERGANGDVFTPIVLDNVTFAQASPGNPFILLNDTLPAGSYGDVMVKARQVVLQLPGASCFVQYNSPRITGSIEDSSIPAGVPFLLADPAAAAPGRPRIKLIDRGHSAPPRPATQVLAGAEEYVATGAVAGQYGRWVSASDASTHDGARWQGLDLVGGPADLAAYLKSPSTTCVIGSGTPASLFWGYGAWDGTTFTESTGSGYARGTGGLNTAANYAANGTTSAANLHAITFSTLTGTLTGITGIAPFAASSGGSPVLPVAYLPGCENGVARTLISGMIPTLAAGAVVETHL